MAITGAEKHKKRLNGIAKDTAKRVVQALYLAGQAIELDAERSITAGSVSGKNHVPSAPGQPPNRDTGLLDSSIETTITDQSPPTVHVTANAPYAAFLEFGTSRMAERPFMRPAATKKRGEAVAIVKRAVVELTKR